VTATGGEEDLLRWQRRLLPVMVGMLFLLTLYFVIESVIQIRGLNRYIRQEARLDVAAVLPAAAVPKDPAEASYTQLRVLAALEAHAMQLRYHQSNLLIMSRSWTRYFGFMTGMVLALIGATFVLGKLQEAASKFEAGTATSRWVLESSSPGLFLTMFGTLLMVVSILTKLDVAARDSAIFTAGWLGGAPVAAPAGSTANDGLIDSIISGAKP